MATEVTVKAAAVKAVEAAVKAAVEKEFKNIKEEQTRQMKLLQAFYNTTLLARVSQKELLEDMRVDVVSLGIKCSDVSSWLFDDLRTVNQGINIVNEGVNQVNLGMNEGVRAIAEVNDGVKVIGFNVVKPVIGSLPYLNSAIKVLNTLVALLPLLDSSEKMLRNRIHGSMYYFYVTIVLVVVLTALVFGTTMPNRVKGVQVVIFIMALIVGFVGF